MTQSKHTQEPPVSKVDTDIIRAAADLLCTKQATLNAAADLIDQCRLQGFIDESGAVRKVLGTLPITADGCVLGDNARLWVIDHDMSVTECRRDCDLWRSQGPRTTSFIGSVSYSTREAALAAQGTKEKQA